MVERINSVDEAVILLAVEVRKLATEMVAVQRRLDALEARHQDTQEQDQAPGRIMTALIRINAAIDYLIMRPKIIEPTSEPSPGNEQRRIASSQRLLPKPRD